MENWAYLNFFYNVLEMVSIGVSLTFFHRLLTVLPCIIWKLIWLVSNLPFALSCQKKEAAAVTRSRPWKNAIIWHSKGPPPMKQSLLPTKNRIQKVKIWSVEPSTCTWEGGASRQLTRIFTHLKPIWRESWNCSKSSKRT